MCELLTHAFWTGSMVTSFVFYSCSQRTLTNWWPLRQITLSTQVMEQGKKTYLVVTWTAFSISWKKKWDFKTMCLLSILSEKQKFLLRAHTYQARSLIGSDASGLSGNITFGWLPLRLSVTPTDQSSSLLGKTIQLHVAPGFNLYTELRSPASFCPWWFLGESKLTLCQRRRY